MSTQTGSISFESTNNFSQVVKQNYATLSQIKGQFATCGTGASTAAKVANIVPTNSNWTLYEGATVTVKFTSKNTTAAPTLNVNGTGAKTIKDYNGNALDSDAYNWPEGAAMSFTYDGTSWRLQDSNLMERVHTAETGIKQTATSITSLATLEDTYIKPDGTTGTNSIKSQFKQTADSIDAKVDKNGVIASINASVEEENGSQIKISADKVNIEGAAIFSSGRLSTTSLNNAYDAKGAASAAEQNAKSYTDTNAAPKTSAVSRTQRIYYRTNTALSSTITGPTTWITKNDNGFNTSAPTTAVTGWSTKPTPLAASTAANAAKYLYLYTCTQTQTVSQAANNGTGCSASTVLLDDTETIIDGGSIITNSIAANTIKADSGTFNTANIPDLSAAKITSGNIAAARIQANAVSAINATANKIDAKNINVNEINIGSLAGEIGGRNLLVGDICKIGKWIVNAPSGANFTKTELDNGYGVTISFDSAGGYEVLNAVSPLTVEIGETYTLSCKYSVGKAYTCTYSDRAYGISIRTDSGTHGSYDTNSNCIAVCPLPTGVEEGKSSVTFEATAATIYLCMNGGMIKDGTTGLSFTVRELKLERGNKATDWTPAPEDIDSAIDDASQIASNYIHADSSGIRIASANPATQNQRLELTNNNAIFYDKDGKKRTQVDNNGLHIFDASSTPVEVALFGSTVGTTGTTAFARIGKSDSSRFEISPTTLSAYTGNTKYFEVSANGLSWGNNVTAASQSYVTSQGYQTSSQVTSLIDSNQNVIDAKKHTQVIISATNVNYVADTCILTARLYIDGILQTSTSLKWQWYKDGTAQGSQTTGATGTLNVTSTLGIAHRYSCKCTF